MEDQPLLPLDPRMGAAAAAIAGGQPRAHRQPPLNMAVTGGTDDAMMTSWQSHAAPTRGCCGALTARGEPNWRFRTRQRSGDIDLHPYLEVFLFVF